MKMKIEVSDNDLKNFLIKKESEAYSVIQRLEILNDKFIKESELLLLQLHDIYKECLNESFHASRHTYERLRNRMTKNFDYTRNDRLIFSGYDDSRISKSIDILTDIIEDK